MKIISLGLVLSWTFLTTHAAEPPVLQPGVRWVFFNGTDFTRPDGAGVEAQVNHDTGGQFNDYARFWCGALRMPATGEITISAEADNGVRVTLDGLLVVDAWMEGASQTGKITAEDGQVLPLQVEFYQNGGVSFCRLYWSWPGHERELIPPSAFVHTAADVALADQLAKGETTVDQIRAWKGTGKVVMEQVISREDTGLESHGALGRMLSVGRDGRVYLMGHGYVMRIERDGRRSLGSKTPGALQGIAVNADGFIATAHAHAQASVYLWDDTFQRLARISDFPAGDEIGWNNPPDVQVGASGNFYALDLHRERIVHLNQWGKRLGQFSLQDSGESVKAHAVRFRVNENLSRFYLVKEQGQVIAVGFDGKKIWTSAPLGIGGDEAGGFQGEFDSDDDGNVYAIQRMDAVVTILGPDGQPQDSLRLEIGDRKGIWQSLRLAGDEIYLKRRSATELFQVYDRATGKLLRVVDAQIERFKIEYPSAIWTAGQPIEFKISLSAGEQTTQPPWPVQIARFNDPEWTTLPVVDGKITPPADATGLYRVKVECGEYRQDGVVEIRVPDSKGTVNILTPKNRVYYGHGEEIPVKVIARGAALDSVRLFLRELSPHPNPLPQGEREQADPLSPPGERVRVRGSVIWDSTLKTAGDQPSSFTLPASLVSSLLPGRYLLTADAPGFTVVPQTLIIGPGFVQGRPAFSFLYHGNGGGLAIHGDYRDLPEAVVAHVERTRRLGQNLFMEWIDPPGGLWYSSKTKVEPIMERLARDPLGVAPEKADIENSFFQTFAAYSAYGIEFRPVIIGQDSLLPLGPGLNPGSYNTPPPEVLQAGVKHISRELLPYPAFTGWHWAMMWWIQPNATLPDKADRTAWETLRTNVLSNGVWDAEVERITDQFIAQHTDASQTLNAALQEVAPGKLHSAPGPDRQPWVIPPITFRDVDEVDLMLQAEQVQPPQIPPHEVDYYKRPGKRALGHPEWGNDDGTGGQLFANVMQGVMRGAGGMGWTGKVPGWRRLKEPGPYMAGRFDNDPRLPILGGASVARAAGAIFNQYGPWLTTLEANDHVAILVSTRMLRVDGWDGGIGGGGLYFTKLFEAYQSCLYAHRPASFVFTEDATPAVLKKYKAILIVSQAVELDPPLQAALKGLADRVYYDANCREEWVKSFKPIGIPFDNLAREAAYNDDSMYYRWPIRFKKNAARLIELFGASVPPVAEVANPEIMLSERVNGEGRFVWAVNNDTSDWEPGLMWRVAMFIGHRSPQVVPIGLNAKGQTIYDVFAMKQVTGETVADLQKMPARLFAVLPKPIESVKLTAKDGEWKVTVTGPKTTYPLRMRLLDEAGGVIEEFYPVTTTGKLAFNGGATLEAIELISGKSASVAVTGTPPHLNPLPRRGEEAGLRSPLPLGERVRVRGTVEELFGPHLWDAAISPDGSTALVNAMNWDDNYYLFDTATGKVRQQGAFAHHYAFGPVTAGKDFYLMGFDLNTAEGFQFYQLDANAKPQRRFANYGIPGRGTKTWTGSRFDERVNHYAVAPNGSWVASAGNLGLIVWSRDGKKLWSLDWYKDSRETRQIFAQNNDILITAVDMTATAYRATTGEKIWEHKFSNAKDFIDGCSVSADGKTVALFSDTLNGRVYILRDGKVVNTLCVWADDHCLTPDGKFLAMVVNNELRWYATDGGLLWMFQGDDSKELGRIPLHEPRLSPDGTKIAVGSSMGSLWILDAQGKTLLDRDLGAIPTTRWLSNDELLVVTWMGDVIRLDTTGKEQWRVKVQAKGPSRMGVTPAVDATPTVRAIWKNSIETPVALTPNLLAETKAKVSLAWVNGGGEVHKQIPDELLTDGKADPLTKPWMDWHYANIAGSGWTGPLGIQFDCGQKQVSLTGITFVEDAAHPESWLRDMKLEWWDAAKGAWMPGPYLLADSAWHTHRFEKPLESTRFRLISGKTWLYSNVRLGEVVFHGEVLGMAHPDVIANRPVATLFDEYENALRTVGGINVADDGGFAGDKYLTINPGIAAPGELPEIGAAIPTWDFEIVENPTKPGQYRWLQFAWKAQSPDIQGAAVLFGWEWAQGVYGVVGGKPSYSGLPDGRNPGGPLPPPQVVDKPTDSWQVVRVDLWKIKQESFRINCLGFVATGSGVAFDQIILARTEADLPKK